MSFFSKTWGCKISPSKFAVTSANSTVDKKRKLVESMALIEVVIEPVLANAGPFFRGCKKLNFVEVYMTSFVKRCMVMAEDGEIIPRAFLDEMEKLGVSVRWSNAILAH